jgi:hypothetical protein
MTGVKPARSKAPVSAAVRKWRIAVILLLKLLTNPKGKKQCESLVGKRAN